MSLGSLPTSVMVYLTRWLADDDDLAWILGYGYGGDLYVITPEAVAATE